MQIKNIVVALATNSISNALAGPLPVPLDANGNAISLRDSAAVIARAEQVQQAGQSQQHDQAAQGTQSQQGRNSPTSNADGWDDYPEYLRKLYSQWQTQYNAWYNQVNCIPGQLC